MDVGTFAQFLTTVLGFSVLILVALGYFIYVLFQGLNTHDAIVIDHKPEVIDGDVQTRH
ncbi:MAG: hypothetical protein KIG60_02070 [Caryophanon sp.]|nr:hypothetical protein [Caryophanon sp.]